MINILIIRLSSIGDIFHTFTLLPDIKKNLPNAQIDWLVNEDFVDIVKLSPLVDNVIAIPIRRWKKNKLTWLYNLINFKKKLEVKKYDYIIDTQGLIKTGFLSKFLFNGKLYGLDWNSAREGLASLFYENKINVNQNNVAVIRLRGLIAKIFNLDIELNKFEFIIKRQINKTNHPDYVLLLHGTSREDKKWALNYWVELANYFLTNSKLDIILTYSNDTEYQFANNLIKVLNNNRIKLIDKLDIDKLVELIGNANLVIGVDTGFTHLSALLGVKTIAIYQSSDPNYVGLLETTTAKNIGGKHVNVLPNSVIEQANQWV